MSPDSLLSQEMAEQPRVLANVLDANPQLAAARAAIAASNHVRLVGIGSSRHVASYGLACFEAFSAVPTSLLPAPGAGVVLPSFSSAEVVLLVSQSGSTPALLPVAHNARAAGAFVITITNADDSALEHLADCALHTHAGPEEVIPATKSVTTSMLLLRALAGPVHDVAAFTAAAAAVLARDLTADADVPQVVVASGFAAEAVADEVALKLAEVTGALAVAETVIDYLHGPAAVPARVLALLDHDDPNSTAVTSLEGVLVVDLPHLHDPSLAAIVRVIAGQRLALEWAQRRGLDPDDPRGLQKVTLTL